jgi:hypothetical protein
MKMTLGAYLASKCKIFNTLFTSQKKKKKKSNKIKKHYTFFILFTLHQ